jgi:uncharacterized protein (TIGR02996 family)
MPLDDDTFIAAILADPQEEANWLVYADWLEERGDPRAALYRRRRLTNSIAMAFVLVPRGTFWMGDGGGKPGDRQVEIAHEFYLGVYPVTQGQWQAIMGSNPSYFSRTGGGATKVEKIADTDLKQFPVEQVSWDDAQEFIRKLNEQEPAPSGWVYRLPTEEEWEYASRGGASSQEECSFDFYLDQPTNDLSSTRANFNGNYPAGSAAKGPYRGRTTKVGSYPPNHLGFYDLHGNVWQWTASVQGSDRVFRGGGWGSSGTGCRAADRVRCTPTGGTTTSVSGLPEFAAGTPDGAGDDMKKARQLARAVGKPRAVLRRCRERARAILALHRAVERLADVLIADGEISGTRAAALFDQREPLQEVWR